MPNFAMMKLGRLPSKKDYRALRFATYSKKLPPPPAFCAWDGKLSRLTMAGNDDYGDCVYASSAHMTQIATANESTEVIPSDADVVREYLAFTGGRDNGANILDALKSWRKKGDSGLWGQPLWAFVAIDPTNHEQLQQAISILGAVKFGVDLPTGWRNADIWDLDGRPGSWGGHDVCALGYDSKYVYVYTWGEKVPVTYPAIDEYVSEAHALLLPAWIARDAISPSGFDLAALHDDLFAVGNLEGTRWSE
jgi:hypothetical protein